MKDDHFSNKNQPCIGVLLTNLGTPDAPTPKAVRKYLAEFLWDPRVVQIPRLIWWFILHGIILNTRPKKSAANYQKVWTDEGSPLLVIAQKQQAALQKLLDNEDQAYKVALGMRYGTPSIKNALDFLKASGIDEVIALPLYPQYAEATVASTYDAVEAALKTWEQPPSLHKIEGYPAQPNYIHALVESIKEHWRTHPRGQKLIFSYHGLPQRSVDNGDPYYDHCKQTLEPVVNALGLKSNEWEMVFQSRFGAEKWLQPYCDKRLEALPSEGITSVDIICPGFSADCIETLEEIAMTNQEIFIEAGGKQLNYIAALNDSPAHINALESIITSF